MRRLVFYLLHLYNKERDGKERGKLKTGMVLEGGGMRGIYTVGVLDVCKERAYWPDYVIGVSAGASNSASYLSRQQGRGLRTNLDYLEDKRYLSLSNWRKHRSLFGMDFLFRQIPETLDPFDFAAFAENPCSYTVGVTNVHTGKAEYFGKEAMCKDSTILAASCSIPVFSPPVAFRGALYCDGGTADPIPFRKALEDGCQRLIIVLTRHRGYRKPPQRFRPIYRHALRSYPALIDTLAHRHTHYNQTLDALWELEQQGQAIVIAPDAPLPGGTFEKKRETLMAIYQRGREDALRIWPQIQTWIDNRPCD